ncbi:MAG: cytochrome c [Gemmataceae bacterium]
MLIALCSLTAGCQQQMANQPRYDPLEASEFFADGRSARPLPAGTVARGTPIDQPHLLSGRKEWQPDVRALAAIVAAAAAPSPLVPFSLAGSDVPFSNTFPFRIDRAVLERGRERYTIYCAVCHGPTGAGNGIVVQRGYVKPPSYHEPRLRAAPAGYLFEVITRGYGAMPDYASEVPPRDRWAIVTYLRALQFSQNVPLAALSPEQRQKLSEAEKLR